MVTNLASSRSGCHAHYTSEVHEDEELYEQLFVCFVVEGEEEGAAGAGEPSVGLRDENLFSFLQPDEYYYFKERAADILTYC